VLLHNPSRRGLACMSRVIQLGLRVAQLGAPAATPLSRPSLSITQGIVFVRTRIASAQILNEQVVPSSKR
jgi:hypothetical protein